MPILDVRGLKTYFYSRRGITKAVDDVSFTLEEGETLGIVGESGCGKTVTSLSLLRLVPKPAGKIIAGEVFFNGEDLLSKNESEMRHFRGRYLSMILQDPIISLNPVFSIGTQIAECFRIHDKENNDKKLWDKVVNIMKLVQIPSPENRLTDFPHQYSGGMRQRIVGAISLACKPHLLIADEPTTSLDVTIQAQYLKLLKDIQREHKLTIIFVTHDFGIVAKMCSKVAVMYAGKIVETAGVKELFHNPAHPYTRALLNSVPKVEEKVERLYSIEGQPPSLINLPDQCSFVYRCLERIDRCENDKSPPEISIGKNHQLRCWKYV
jgi:oligopeptide/dipeptide ABC transporter ATP-binding protein